jgi:hypothetical protein
MMVTHHARGGFRRGRELINLERPADVRFAGDNGLKSGMAPCPKSADIVAKSFWGAERKFLEPLMRFSCRAVMDHIISSKIDHGHP